MPEPTVVGILGSIIVVLLGILAMVMRSIIAGKLVPGARYAEMAARADRYETMLMQVLGANERLIPLVERQAQIVQTVEDVVGHSMSTESEASR